MEKILQYIPRFINLAESEKLKSIVKKVFEARKNAQKSYGYLFEAIADHLENIFYLNKTNI